MYVFFAYIDPIRIQQNVGQYTSPMDRMGSVFILWGPGCLYIYMFFLKHVGSWAVHFFCDELQKHPIRQKLKKHSASLNIKGNNLTCLNTQLIFGGGSNLISKLAGVRDFSFFAKCNKKYSEGGVINPNDSQCDGFKNGCVSRILGAPPNPSKWWLFL